MSRSEFPRWGNERADESQTRASLGVNRNRTRPITEIEMQSPIRIVCAGPVFLYNIADLPSPLSDRIPGRR